MGFVGSVFKVLAFLNVFLKNIVNNIFSQSLIRPIWSQELFRIAEDIFFDLLKVRCPLIVIHGFAFSIDHNEERAQQISELHLVLLKQ